MKKGVHPENYRLVAFKDMSNGETFITRSCADSKEKIKIDGVEYPLIKREITSTSHPFYTGKMKLVDSAGRIDKFYSRFGKNKNESVNQKKDENLSSDVVATEEVSLAEEVSAEETSTEETSTEETSTEEASTEVASTEDASTEDASTEETSTEEASTGKK
jgi:large subunit ribosomal protein L31